MAQPALAMPVKEPLTGKTLGLRIRNAYMRAGLNRAQFARALDVHYTTVFKWEKGETEPKHENLIQTSDITGFSTDELLGMATIEAVAMYPGFDEFKSQSPTAAQLTEVELNLLKDTRFAFEPTPRTYDMLAMDLIARRKGKALPPRPTLNKKPRPGRKKLKG